MQMRRCKNIDHILKSNVYSNPNSTDVSRPSSYIFFFTEPVITLQGSRGVQNFNPSCRFATHGRS